jgi:hypothetical protein
VDRLELSTMNEFSELFNDLSEWLTVGIIIFMLAMMAYLTSKKTLSTGLRVIFVTIPVDVSTGE